MIIFNHHPYVVNYYYYYYQNVLGNNGNEITKSRAIIPGTSIQKSPIWYRTHCTVCRRSPLDPGPSLDMNILTTKILIVIHIFWVCFFNCTMTTIAVRAEFTEIDLVWFCITILACFLRCVFYMKIFALFFPFTISLSGMSIVYPCNHFCCKVRCQDIFGTFVKNDRAHISHGPCSSNQTYRICILWLRYQNSYFELHFVCSFQFLQFNAEMPEM